MNTKNYKVIPIDNYGVVVTRKLPIGTINPGDWYAYQLDNWVLMQCQDQDEADRCNSNTVIGVSSAKIMFSIGKRLDGVPLIELVDDDPFNLIDGYTVFLKRQLRLSEINTLDWVAKANTNKYSEEDIRKAIVLAVTSPTDFIPELCNEIIQSLQQPIPTEVELEMEIVSRLMSADIVKKEGWVKMENHSNTFERIKITNKETNTITSLNYK